jgi:Arc/MetJ family transcription regulator
VGEIVHDVGELGQKSKGKGNGNSKSKNKGTTVMRRTKAVAIKATAVEPRSRVRVQAPGETDGNSASKKAGASAPAARVPAVRRRQSSNAKPRSAVSIGSEPPSPEPRGRKPPSVSKMDSVEIVLRSRSSTRSPVRGGGAKTGGEKTMTDSEGKVRKRRKVAARTAA